MITAIILAAGESTRMGEPKMLMPWGRSTVLQTVISTFQAADVRDILLVTGGARERVERLVGKTVQTIYNEDYKKSGMLGSIQLGLTAKMREALALTTEYDWSKISPAIFGAMFQTVKSKEERRNLGEHYTSEANILKVIRPLFLDDFATC